jgi:hypothetical protein
MNVLVIGDRWGRLVKVSDPTPGAMHDARSFVETGLDRLLAQWPVLADLGFLGCGVQTPLRKPPGGTLCELEKANNRAHASIRAAVERTIALLKQWKVLASGYRGPLASFPKVIRKVVALEKFRIYENPFVNNTHSFIVTSSSFRGRGPHSRPPVCALLSTWRQASRMSMPGGMLRARRSASANSSAAHSVSYSLAQPARRRSTSEATRIVFRVMTAPPRPSRYASP